RNALLRRRPQPCHGERGWADCRHRCRRRAGGDAPPPARRRPHGDAHAPERSRDRGADRSPRRRGRRWKLRVPTRPARPRRRGRARRTRVRGGLRAHRLGSVAVAYGVLKAVLTPILRFFFRVRVEGIEHVPDEGPVILASNHVSFSDSIFLPMVLRRRVTFVAKAEYFEKRKTAWLFRALGQIPIKREGGSASQRALQSATEVLEGGGLFGIYPEGTRSPDGRLYKGHTGVARLALQSGAPVLAVAMVGTREAQPIGQVMPKVFMP